MSVVSMRRASSCSRPPSSLTTASTRSSRSSAMGSSSAISSTVDGGSRLRSCPRVRPRMWSGGSMGSWTSSSGSLVGSASFQVGRQRDRSAEMELFRMSSSSTSPWRRASKKLLSHSTLLFIDSQHRKPRSTYRRPSSLGLSSSAFDENLDHRQKLTIGNGDRSHIVRRRPDNLRVESRGQETTTTTEIRDKFKNHSPTRPTIQRSVDHLKPEGGLEEGRSETRAKFGGQKAIRPVIRKIADHNQDVIPAGPLHADSEYRKNFREAGVKGERVEPVWVSKFEKVTIDGEDTSRNQ